MAYLTNNPRYVNVWPNGEFAGWYDRGGALAQQKRFKKDGEPVAFMVVLRKKVKP